MADWPVEEFGGKTILQNARKPYMDMLARKGRTGMLKTVRPCPMDSTPAARWPT